MPDVALTFPRTIRDLRGQAAPGGMKKLVVGSRGSGGFARLLMGSVSSQVTHHAACPVVIIPGSR